MRLVHQEIRPLRWLTTLIDSNNGIISDRNFQSVDGIAITSVDNTNGTWQYTVNGSDWATIAPVAMNDALLLANSAETKIRFIPSADFNGTIAEGLSFKAWDRYTGTSEGRMDATNAGGFSRLDLRSGHAHLRLSTTLLSLT